MLFSTLINAIPAALLLSGANASPVNELNKKPRQSSLDDFIKNQADISIKGVLANIGGGGSKAQGVSAGIVVASPSKSNPDYWYTWTRDAALTYKALAERLVATGDANLRQLLDDYAAAQAQLQGVSNPSGGPTTGGLGEPKFNVDKTAFTGSWGRPQRDGPPLRATALTIYSNWLLANNGQAQANNIWPTIAKDLDYAVRYWNQTGYDLWEEVSGSSFFTASATQRALVEGAALAKALGKDCPGCAAAAPQVLCFMDSFWTGSYIDSNINVNEGRTGKDVNSILSSIHTFDPTSKCTDSTFQPCSSRALLNHKAVTDSFRTVFPINKGIPQGQAVAVGRYAEDVYSGTNGLNYGNPWYLATTAAAEQLYAALYQWDKVGSITIDSVSLPFFKDLISSSATGTFARDSATYKSIVAAVKTYADGYMAIVQRYTPASGALSEQFDKNSGTAISASDLTWSYAAFLTAYERRSGVMTPSWGEPQNNAKPSSCSAPSACNAKMTFNVKATTTFGENIFVVGQLATLGNWDPASAKPLSASKYTSSNPLWYAEIDLPAATAFDYKYIRKSSSGVVTWESDPNRRSTTSDGCGSTGSVNDTWR